MSTTVDTSTTDDDEKKKKKKKKKKRKPRTPPTEVDYYSQMLNSTRGKKYELYAVSRVLHLLDDSDLELVTQQPIRLDTGELRLLDLYFPQLAVGLEVDEPFHDKTKAKDRIREQAIIERSAIDVEHVQVLPTDSLGTLTEQVDAFIESIRTRKRAAVKAGNFVPFVYGNRFDPKHWVSRGVLTTSDDAQLQKTVDVGALFGKTVGAWRGGILPLAGGAAIAAWMPGLNQKGVKPRDDWNNEVSPDGKTIIETQLRAGKYNYVLGHRRIVFGKFKDPVFLHRYYRFLGEYEVVHIEVLDETGRQRATYTRRSESVDLSALQLS